MIRSLPITLAQGLSLHSAFIEVSQIELDAREVRDVSERYVRDNGELKESNSESGADFEVIVTGLRFKALVWVNENTHQQDKPAFDLMDKDHKTAIEIDFAKYPAIAEHFDNGFNPEATKAQRLEGTCERFISTVLVDLLKA